MMTTKATNNVAIDDRIAVASLLLRNGKWAFGTCMELAPWSGSQGS